MSRSLKIALLAYGVIATAGSQSVAPPRFEDYPVLKIYRGPVKPPDFGNLAQYSGTDLRCFGAEPSEYAKEKVNFAGHFVLDSCSCGSGCRYLFMWDAVTGRFYRQVPPGIVDVGPFEGRDVKPLGIVYKGEQHRFNSSLLIVEGCVEDTCDCATRYYRWTGSRFKLILRQPVRMPSRCVGAGHARPGP